MQKSRLLTVLGMAILSIGLFLMDFLPHNYNEFQTICTNEWSNDSKQYTICMKPYFDQISTDKLAIGFIILICAASLLFFLTNKTKGK